MVNLSFFPKKLKCNHAGDSVAKNPVSDVFQHYLAELKKSVSKGDYTEMTLRTPLENLIRGLNTDYDVTHEAKKIKELGAPDFTAYRASVNVGYVEAKDLGKNLDEELESKQLKKYRESIDNIVLTDYRRFILIRGSQTIFDQSLFSLADLRNPKSRISDSKIEEFLQLTDTFFGYSQPTIKSAKVLAEELAKKTKLLKDLATEQLEEDLLKVQSGLPPSSLYDFYETLNELIQDISVVDCADAYAQTITYGLFLAKINEEGSLDRETAASHIPRNIKIIRKIFSSIAGDALPANVSWIVDALIDILNASEVDEILSEIDFRGKKDRDPFTFFYEDFLALYEPEKKKRLGVYYTPRPVVSFIVKSVNQILKDEFDKPMGLAEDGLTILDPAVGTGTFLWLVYLSTLVELKDKGLGGVIPNKIKNHILKDFYGFELLITPYIISHLKLTSVLKKWFYEFQDDDRVQVYLTNTLEPFETHAYMPFFRELTEESETADNLKLKKSILAVVGNPPYSVSSSNKSKWILEKMQDYKRGLNEKNIQPLDDDYIKFIRFAEWKIEQNSCGVIGFITNNSYLDGLIHRRMREHLISTFDRIYILNLHGDSARREKSPDGTKDENVFDIQQGVAIGLFIKSDAIIDKKVFHADLFGEREQKYNWLDTNTISTVPWLELAPTAPHYFFVPKDFALQQTYNEFWSITDIFGNYSSGVQTGKDHLSTDINRDQLISRVKTILSDPDEKKIREIYSLQDTSDWSLKRFKTATFDDSKVVRVLYRPFDFRWVFYDKHAMQRDRYATMRHFLAGKNVGLVIVRQFAEDEMFNHVFVTDTIADRRITLSKRGAGFIFPLYTYRREGAAYVEEPNFKDDFVKFIEERYAACRVTPIEILGYIYAILHSPTYREIYNEFLKIDFPRINFVKDYISFKSLSEVGLQLLDLHLMKLNLKTSMSFNVTGSNIVEFVKYKEGKTYINKTQFFNGIPEDVWTFYIGGYQVLDKWLKSRKGRELSSGEIERFLQIVETIKKTIKHMQEIDQVAHFGS